MKHVQGRMGLCWLAVAPVCLKRPVTVHVHVLFAERQTKRAKSIPSNYWENTYIGSLENMPALIDVMPSLTRSLPSFLYQDISISSKTNTRKNGVACKN